jgi:hypothetical protein
MDGQDEQDKSKCFSILYILSIHVNSTPDSRIRTWLDDAREAFGPRLRQKKRGRPNRFGLPRHLRLLNGAAYLAADSFARNVRRDL